jgi:hypothetical protein
LKKSSDKPKNKGVGKFALAVIIVELLLIAYFAASLGLFGPQIAAIAYVARPFIVVVIALFNVVLTVATLFLAALAVVTGLSNKQVSDNPIFTAKLIAEGRIKFNLKHFLKLLFACAFVWLAWNYGAFYMASAALACVLAQGAFMAAFNSVVNQAEKEAAEKEAAEKEAAREGPEP